MGAPGLGDGVLGGVLDGHDLSMHCLDALDLVGLALALDRSGRGVVLSHIAGRFSALKTAFGRPWQKGPQPVPSVGEED
jgi:ABC-type proline/glycine betaine transport system permease subunit